MHQNFSIHITIMISILMCIMACEDDKNDNNPENQSVIINLIETDECIVFEKTVIIFENEQYIVRLH